MAPAKHLEPLRPLIGRWRTFGTILDEDGSVAGEISGTDIYTWLPGGHWIVHEVDVRMGEERTQVLELIGGRDDTSGGWQMHAFDTADNPGRMRLTIEGPGLLLLQGTGVRSWLRPEAGPDQMTTLWEREVIDQWIPWMDMHFEREAP
ncbi:MAG TPA: hypothetical protein VJ301_11835 [Propionibacteriaceae bacterium]|nr:hypothetical protein [Propionibacteriaceae bacterium]